MGDIRVGAAARLKLKIVDDSPGYDDNKGRKSKRRRKMQTDSKDEKVIIPLTANAFASFCVLYKANKTKWKVRKFLKANIIDRKGVSVDNAYDRFKTLPKWARKAIFWILACDLSEDDHPRLEDFKGKTLEEYIAACEKLTTVKACQGAKWKDIKKYGDEHPCWKQDGGQDEDDDDEEEGSAELPKWSAITMEQIYQAFPGLENCLAELGFDRGNIVCVMSLNVICTNFDVTIT